MLLTDELDTKQPTLSLTSNGSSANVLPKSYRAISTY